jgi:alanine racemase
MKKIGNRSHWLQPWLQISQAIKVGSIHGQRCIVRSVNMNMMTVDVTDINLAKKHVMK